MIFACQCWVCYRSTGKSNREDEKIVLKELASVLACLYVKDNILRVALFFAQFFGASSDSLERFF